ncbi:MAG: putative porin [Pseudomonadota bacterium]
MKTKILSLSVALVFALPIGMAHAASERESLEILRQTTVNLIEGLVEQGVFTREKADAMIKAAEKKAAATAKAEAQAAPGRVRVQYVPEHVKSEIREQIKQEVLAQAKTERWAEPNAIPSWLDSIKWEGDLRLRYQVDDFASGNTKPMNSDGASGYVWDSYEDLMAVSGFSAVDPNATTRAADFAKVNSRGEPTGNTTEKRERFRLRARLGMLAKVSESWSGGIRLATGSATDRVSTNQTLGQDWNKYTLLVDRAFLKYDPVEWLSISGGRIPNPWFSTDLVWDEDLNFEGMVASWKPILDNGTIKPFLTVGAFPLKEENPPASSGRWMHGVQAGTQWDFNSDTRLKVGLAWYGFKDFEGRVESDSSLDLSGGPTGPAIAPSYGQYEYSSKLRQKGNTLFRTNAPSDSGTTSYWGLASKFRPVSLTASLDLAHFDPLHVILTADWVKNTAFDRSEIATRTQGRVNLTDGKSNGYQYKLTVGMPQLKEARDWQVSMAYRYLGSDAVVDAFTDSDFGGGGTNLKGYTLGLQYAVDRNAVVGLRWLSADQIDSFAPGADYKFSLDVLQADVNVRF